MSKTILNFKTFNRDGIPVWKDEEYPDFEIHNIADHTFSIIKYKDDKHSDYESIGDIYATLDDAIAILEREVEDYLLADQPARISIRTNEQIKRELQAKADRYAGGNISHYCINSALGKTKVHFEWIEGRFNKELIGIFQSIISKIAEKNEILSMSYNFIPDGDIPGPAIHAVFILKDMSLQNGKQEDKLSLESVG